MKGDGAAAKLLGVDRSRVSQLLGERSLYAFAAEEAQWFPLWQFHGARTIPHLREVLAALDQGLHPLTVTHWFITADVDLAVDDDPLSPRDWLLKGSNPNPVATLAAQL